LKSEIKGLKNIQASMEADREEAMKEKERMTMEYTEAWNKQKKFNQLKQEAENYLK
jgi:hypothetical protein